MKAPRSGYQQLCCTEMACKVPYLNPLSLRILAVQKDVSVWLA